MKKKLTQNWCPPPLKYGGLLSKKSFSWVGGGGTFSPKKLFIGGTFAGKD